MDDLQQALSQIKQIRHQVARSTQFRGYGPRSIAFSGLLALSVAFAQDNWYPDAQHDLASSLVIWTLTAAAALALSAVDTVRRSRKVHVESAPAMLHVAVEQFIPALVVGALLTAVIFRVSPTEGWLFAVGVWYLGAGLCSIVACSAQKCFLPWTMGLPFGIGQLLVAVVLQVCVEENPADV
jgi:type IV secretory pathway TrbD component